MAKDDLKAELPEPGQFGAGMIDSAVTYDGAKYLLPFGFHIAPMFYNPKVFEDAGVEGRLFNSYFMGNFLGYWLSPELRAFVNGSLNLPPQTMRDGRALMARTGRGEEMSFTELLDHHSIDERAARPAEGGPPPGGAGALILEDDLPPFPERPAE